MIDPLHDRIQRLKHDRKNYRSPNAAPYTPTDTRTAVTKAPKCERCRKPMMCGQKGTHLSCR